MRDYENLILARQEMIEIIEDDQLDVWLWVRINGYLLR